MNRSKITIVPILITSLLIFWGAALLIFSLRKKSITQEIELPNGYQKVVAISPNAALENSFHELISNPKYQQLYENLRTKFSAPNSNLSLKNSGIDVFSPILLVNDKNGQHFVLVTLKNSSLFETFAQKNELKVKISGKKAFISLEKSAITIPTNWEKHSLKTKNLVTIFGNKNDAIRINVAENHLRVAGTLLLDSASCLQFIPKPQYFTLIAPISFSKLPSDKLPAVAKEILKNITALAVDFQGIHISEKGPIPLFNATFRAKDSLKIDLINTQLQKSLKTSLRKVSAENYEVIISGKTYYLKSLGNQEWFFGTDSNAIQQNSTHQYLSIVGQPSALMNIQGNFLISAGLSFVPGFAPTKTFLQQMERSTITGVLVGKQLKINGNLQFKTGENPILEVLKYVLAMN